MGLTRHLQRGRAVLQRLAGTQRADASPVSSVTARDRVWHIAGEVKGVLERVAKTYADCVSYRDTGQRTVDFRLTPLMAKWHSGAQDSALRMSFKTAYTRPDRFRFEYAAEATRSGASPSSFAPIPGDRFIVWRRGDKTMSWWGIQPGQKEEAAFASALNIAAGVSDGLSYTISALIFPETLLESRPALTSIAQAVRIEDQELSGVRCLRLQGSLSHHPTMLWIERSTFLVHRVDKQFTLEGSQITETTIYRPSLNGAITEEELAFDAPEI